MHGNWDDVDEAWDSWSEEYRWDFNAYDTSVLLGAASGFLVKDSFVVFGLLGRLSSKSGVDSNSAGSSFVSTRTLGMKSKVVGTVNAVNGFESLSFGSKSSLAYKDYEVYMPAFGAFTLAADLKGLPNTHVSLTHCFDTGSGMLTSPAGGTYHLESKLKMRTRVSPSKSDVKFIVSGSLGSKSGLTKALEDVIFDLSEGFGLSASLSGLGVTTIPVQGTLGMASQIYGASGNTFFESVVFNGVISENITANYTARDVVYFVAQTGIDVSSIVNFNLEETLSMGMSYTSRDGWWIRLTPGQDNGWDSDNTIEGGWSPDQDGISNGWSSEDF